MAVKPEEAMHAVELLNEAFEEVYSLESDHDKREQLVKLSQSGATDPDWKHKFAAEAANLEVISREQSKFLDLIMNHPAEFRCWLSGLCQRKL